MEAQTKQGQGVPLYEIVKLEQGSSDWLDYRRSKITATDVSTILSLNPFKTPYRLYQEKMGLIEPEPENEKMREGKRLEEEALTFYNKTYYRGYTPCVLVSKKHPFMMASLDGMDEYSQNEIIEIKCGKKSYEQLKQDEIPKYYYAQMQAQLFVSGQQQCLYFCYRSPEENLYKYVYRDNAFIEKMIIEAKEFFRRLMEFDPPPLVEKDYIQKEDKDWRMISHLYNESSKELEICKARTEALRQELIKMSGGQSCKGGGILLTKSSRLGSIKYDSIEALKSVDLNKYRKPSIEVYTIREDKNVSN